MLFVEKYKAQKSPTVNKTRGAELESLRACRDYGASAINFPDWSQITAILVK